MDSASVIQFGNSPVLACSSQSAAKQPAEVITQNRPPRMDAFLLASLANSPKRIGCHDIPRQSSKPASL
jgi:hypothetical protein